MIEKEEGSYDWHVAPYCLTKCDTEKNVRELSGKELTKQPHAINFDSVISKLINVNCLHFIGCQNYTNVLINRVLYQIQVTALLPFFLSILHLLLQLSKIMLWSTVKLLLAIVMSIIFGPLKTLPRSSKSCDCVTFRVLKYLLSTFLLYTPHCHMIWSKQKCCLWSTGVSTESQNLTSVLHLRQDFLAIRNMTRIDVGLARSYVKLLLSSWKTYMYNLMAWNINK